MHQRTWSVTLSVSGRRLLGEGCPKRSSQAGHGARTLLSLGVLCPGVEQPEGGLHTTMLNFCACSASKSPGQP